MLKVKSCTSSRSLLCSSSWTTERLSSRDSLATSDCAFASASKMMELVDWPTATPFVVVVSAADLRGDKVDRKDGADVEGDGLRPGDEEDEEAAASL